MRRIFFLLAASTVAMLAGCGSSSSTSKVGVSPTTTTFSATPNTLLNGAPIQMSAMVTGSLKTAPTGTVTFLSGTTAIGTASVGSGGMATFSGPVQAPVGVDSLTASYGGDAANAASSSTGVSVTVQSQTTTAVSLAPASIAQGQAFVVTATVARVNNTGYATGTVMFENNEAQVPGGVVTLVNGQAQVTLPSAGLALGSYNLTAEFSGNGVDLASDSSNAVATVTAPLDVLTFRNNLARTGVQAAETVLTPANVASNFGKVYSFNTDGYSYAQPLYVAGYLMGDGQYHNVLFVETAAGSIYAFDADNQNPAAGYLWHVSVIPNGEATVTPTDLGCGDTQPNTSIVGTPVIDRAKGVLYVVGKTKSLVGSPATYYQRIHAINLADGTEKMNGPTLIAATASGSGVGSENGVIAFDPYAQNQRSALAESGGSVWIAWASHCDLNNYHGWVIGYNADDLTQQTGSYNTTPNGESGGIWMAGGGISGDDAGNLYVVSGNGTFDGNTGNNGAGQDLADSVQRLTIGSGTLGLADWFSPSDQGYLSAYDQDMGTVEAMLFDDPASAVAPHLLATADKTGRVYILNRDSLGGYDSGAGGANGDVQDVPDGQDIFTNFAYFNGQMYIGPAGLPLQELEFVPGTATLPGSLAFTPTSVTSVTPPGNYNTGGFQPVISANGTANGIAWALSVGSGNLYAFDASNLGTTLFDSSVNPSRDAPAAAVKFTVPVVANGKVYLAGQGAVMVYGLLGQQDRAPARKQR